MCMNITLVQDGDLIRFDQAWIVVVVALLFYVHGKHPRSLKSRPLPGRAPSLREAKRKSDQLLPFIKWQKLVDAPIHLK